MAKSLPLADGFFMPPEWAPHSACYMHWPHRPDTWRQGAKPARVAFTEVAKAISRFEPVVMGVRTDDIESAQQNLQGCPGISLLEMDSDDSWMRDMGPTFLVSKPSTGPKDKVSRKL